MTGLVGWVASIRATLIVVAALLAIAGLVASITEQWVLAAFVFNAAFLCKWVECWLLEKAFVGMQEAK